MREPERDSLTQRQTEIAELLVRGKSTREIALELTLSPRTVETHVSAIYTKYGVCSRAELMLAISMPSDDLPSDATLPPPDAAKTNLPLQRGALVGRTIDIDNIVRLLQANQLVTLTGAGGIGKTQAAIAVGKSLLEEFRGGIWLAELAAVTHGSSVGEAVARALKVEPAEDLALLDSLVAHLQRKMLLLIIDNCEHVIDDVATLADALMRSCPRLKLLATGREPLRIAGEQTYRLPSLAVPAGDDVGGLDAVRGAEFAAIELFTARAQAVDFSFALSDENAPLVAQICRRLDGIPLAIELAAARVKILPLGKLATTIDSHLRILAGGDRLTLPRHRTMHALIDWSYDLLSPPEQRLFERMSVFAGGCALDEIASVYGDERGEPGNELTLLDLLSSLVDKSLLMVDVRASEPRYSLLQSFGQYASEKLESRGESTLMRRRHAAAYTALAEGLEEEYDLAPNEAWYSRAEMESENFLSALDWTLEARNDVLLGQRLAAAMRPVWIHEGGGRRRLQIARDLTDDRTPLLLAARLDYAVAMARYATAEFEEAFAKSRRLVDAYRDLGDPLRAAYAQSLAAFSLLFLGRLDEVDPLIAPALEVARAHERPPLIAFLLRADSLLSSMRGDLNKRRERLVEALAIYQRIGAERHASLIFLSLAEREFGVGNVEHALELATKCLNLQRAHPLPTIVPTLTNLAAYSVASNRWDLARAYGREALELANESQHVFGLLQALQHLAAVAVSSSSHDPGSTSSFARFAEAAQLLGYVDARSSQLGFVRREYTEQQEYDRVLASLAATVSSDDLTRFMARGATLTHEQSIELALSF